MAEFFKKTNTRFRPLDPQFSQTLTEMQTYDLEDKISVLQACMGRDINVLISCSRHLMQIDGVYKEGVEDLDKITEKNKSIG